MKKCFFLVIASFVFGCSKNEPALSSGSGVYVVGSTFNAGGKEVARFWKNGIATNLTDGTANATATGVALSGPSVIVCGSDWSNPLDSTRAGKLWVNSSKLDVGGICYRTQAVAATATDVCVLGLSQYGWTYWRNGSPTAIASVADYQMTGIAVNQGDVYVSGFSRSAAHAQCWKNGVLIYTNPQPSVANAIAVSGSDVYLAGYVPASETPETKAVFWKNGVIHELTSGSLPSQANSIFISAGDVYVGGHEGGDMEKRFVRESHRWHSNG